MISIGKKSSIPKLSAESFRETYGVVRQSLESKEPEVTTDSVFSKLTRGASKKIRSVSLKRRQPKKFSLPIPASAPATPMIARRQIQSTSSFEDEKIKLLKEILEQKEQLLEEQKTLTEKMKNHRNCRSTSSVSSYCSLSFTDNGYCSAFDEEEQDTFTLPSQHRCEEVSEDIIAEIKDFEKFIKSKKL